MLLVPVLWPHAQVLTCALKKSTHFPRQRHTLNEHTRPQGLLFLGAFAIADIENCWLEFDDEEEVPVSTQSLLWFVFSNYMGCYN